MLGNHSVRARIVLKMQAMSSNPHLPYFSNKKGLEKGVTCSRSHRELLAELLHEKPDSWLLPRAPEGPPWERH